MEVNIGDTQKKILTCQVNINGVLKKVISGFNNINGTLHSFNIIKGTPIGTLPIGSIVKMNVNGILRDFIIVHQGLPSSDYDVSCNGTWLLMKDCYTQMCWNDKTTGYFQNRYPDSSINFYLNNTFLDLFDISIQNKIKQVTLPHVGYNVSDFKIKVFLLSGYEIGWTQSNLNKYLPREGAKLDYFTEGSSSSVEKIAYYNGSPVPWWLRSPRLESTDMVHNVVEIGRWNSSLVSKSFGIRPAMILPSNKVFVDEDFNIVV